MKVMVMAGTSDAMCIIGNLADHDDIEVIATTTTQYGGDLAISAGADEIIVGRLGAQEITDLLEVNNIDLLVDATHPFASDATLNAIKSAHKSEIKYIRFERPSISIPNHEKVFEVSTFEEAAKKAMEIHEGNINGKIMHFAGVSTLHHMIKKIQPGLIVVRIIPMVFSLKKCLELGISPVNIIAMQGTFSKEFNKALLKEYAIEIVVTKESGETGGSHYKTAAAVELEIPIIIVKRPKIPELEREIVFNDVADLMENIGY
jgi:precorrin-6A/cobalt-precorrin-6A reductase